MALGRAPRRTIVLPALLLVLGLLATGCGAVAGVVDGVTGGSAPQVRTPGGVLDGVDGGGTHRFLGIRYAEAPVGPLRWADPRPAGPWQGTREATEPGAICPQINDPSGSQQNEDCLFLNVTTPSDLRPGERLPVLVWWHGGGFVNGSGSEYDATRLAEQGRIAVVTVNYRLGTLGYLGLPGLAGSGAFGFADQVQSLRWTKENIAAFGGDPDNLTVAGESAGGASTCALLGSPALTQLAVKRVVVMSGSCSSRFPANGLGLREPPRSLYTSTSDAQAEGRAAAQLLRCPPSDPLGCLRNQPVNVLLRLSEKFSALAYGGELVPADPATRLSGVPPSVSVVYGGMHDEGWSFFRRVVVAYPTEFTPATYTGLLAQAYGTNAGRVLAQYPLSAYGNSAVLAWSTVITDDSWSCAAHTDQQTLAAAGVPTYAYEFDRPEGPPAPDGIPSGGAPHATELPLLFDKPQQPMVPTDAALSRAVVDYWTSFVRTGTPTSTSGPAWPAVPAAGPVTPLRLDPTGIRPVDTGADHRCDFWATVR